MIDIKSLMPQISVLQQKALNSSTIQSQSFDDILNQTIDDVTPEIPSVDASIDSIDTASSLSDDIKAIIKEITTGTPQSQESLENISLKFSVISRRLVHQLNTTMPGPTATQAEIDLHYMIFGTFQLLENYGNKSSVADLMETWKSLDTRTNSYETLITGLIDFIKTKCCELKGLQSSEGTLPDEVNAKKITWELQYEMWEQISAYGNTLRSQPLLREFNEHNQMSSAKVDFNGEKIDSLIDPITPTLDE